MIVNPEIAKLTELLTPEVIIQLKAISNAEPRGIISASTNFSEDRREIWIPVKKKDQ